MAPLPPEAFPSVKFIAFGIFNWSIPDIIGWATVFVLFLIASWLRLPKIFEPSEEN